VNNCCLLSLCPMMILRHACGENVRMIQTNQGNEKKPDDAPGFIIDELANCLATLNKMFNNMRIGKSCNVAQIAGIFFCNFAKNTTHNFA